MIEKEIILEIILGNDATYLVKGAKNVFIQIDQGNSQEVCMYLISRRTWCPFR